MKNKNSDQIVKKLRIKKGLSQEELAEKTGVLVNFNLSALSFMIFPFLGIVIPFIIWNTKKDKIRGLNELAKDLLNFQITWAILVFIGNIVMISFSTLAFLKSGGQTDLFSTGQIPSIFFMGIMYLFNLILIIINSIRINKGKATKYFPRIRFLT